MNNLASIIVALATLLTAVGGFIVMVRRVKNVEDKVDRGAVVQDQIHLSVSKEEISRLKTEALTEIKAELARFREELNSPRRRDQR